MYVIFGLVSTITNKQLLILIGSLCYESLVYDRIIRSIRTAIYEMIVNFQITQRAEMNIICIVYLYIQV